MRTTTLFTIACLALLCACGESTPPPTAAGASGAVKEPHTAGPGTAPVVVPVARMRVEYYEISKR